MSARASVIEEKLDLILGMLAATGSARKADQEAAEDKGEELAKAKEEAVKAKSADEATIAALRRDLVVAESKCAKLQAEVDDLQEAVQTLQDDLDLVGTCYSSASWKGRRSKGTLRRSPRR